VALALGLDLHGMGLGIGTGTCLLAEGGDWEGEQHGVANQRFEIHVVVVERVGVAVRHRMALEHLAHLGDDAAAHLAQTSAALPDPGRADGAGRSEPAVEDGFEPQPRGDVGVGRNRRAADCEPVEWTGNLDLALRARPPQQLRDGDDERARRQL